MGIKILKPSIYLGNRKLIVDKLFKLKKEIILNKIGSNFLHKEEKKNILEMALHVSKKILKNYNFKPNFLIFVSQGQDEILPSIAENLAFQLGLEKNILVLTISSGCSGFVQAIALANKFLNSENKTGLIVCAEKYSKYIDEKDLKTKILFSDAASATIVKYTRKKNYFLESFGYDGKNSKALNIKNRRLEMDGQKIFLFGINNIPYEIKKIQKKITIDRFLIHPGSKIMLDSIIQKSLINPKKVCDSFKITGNTVSSSIPLLININFNKLKNRNILMSGFGVGLSWATIVIKCF